MLNKQREMVPFILNPTQLRLDAALCGRDLVPKARQLGISTYIIARFVAKCIALENRRCVIISHEEEATQRLLATARFILDHLRSPVPGVEIVVDVKQQTQAKIVFSKTNSWFYIGTAGSKAFGRGDTITDLHCSEYAWWPDPAGLFRGLMGSVPDVPHGSVTIESTGNGLGNDFEQRVTRTALGRGDWRVHFLPWQDDPTYQRKLSPAARREILLPLEASLAQLDAGELKSKDLPLEARLVRDFGLSAEQLAWRRAMLENMGDDLAFFRQEFPMTLDECFQAQGGAIFRDLTYRPGPSWVEQTWPGGGEGMLEGHPKSGFTYVIGADTAAGVKLSDDDPHDNSVVQIGCVETEEQVGRWHSGRTTPDVLGGQVLPDLGRRFNNALIVVEANNHGIMTLGSLRKTNYPRDRIFKRKIPDQARPEAGLVDYGFLTTANLKPLAVGRLRELCKDGFILHDPHTYREMLAFVETKAGRLEGQHGSHDDFVMALVMLGVGWVKAGLNKRFKEEAEAAAAEAEVARPKGSVLYFPEIWEPRLRRQSGGGQFNLDRLRPAVGGAGGGIR